MSGILNCRSSATDIANGVRSGCFSAADVCSTFVSRIKERESTVRAWAYFCESEALERARCLDTAIGEGKNPGPLSGVPVGIKDVFDTTDMPTECGSRMLTGRRTDTDASIVNVLRKKGAVLIGKTTTSEFGMNHHTMTRNPLDAERSVGASSSGSAAAVIDRMVPLAIGTQHTASSVIPASYCGAFAMKPTFGLFDMTGANILSSDLAQLSLFANSVSDLRYFFTALHAPNLSAVLADGPAVTENAAGSPAAVIALLPGQWDNVDPAIAERYVDWLDTNAITKEDSPKIFGSAVEAAWNIISANIAEQHAKRPEAQLELARPEFRRVMKTGLGMSAQQYIASRRKRDEIRHEIDRLLAAAEFIVTMSAPDEAPALTSPLKIGSVAVPWSLAGVPVVSLPLLRGPQGLPVGIQIVAKHNRDLALLDFAQHLMDRNSS